MSRTEDDRLSTQLPARVSPEPGAPNGAPEPPVRPSRGRERLALAIALAADLLQLALHPLFVGGALSPFEDGLDFLIALIMIRLLGWHLAFLPTFIAELVPGVDLIPTWTAAVWFVTRTRRRDPS